MIDLENPASRNPLDQAEAEKMAEKIVGLDQRIYTAGIISNTGETLGGYVRPSYRSKFPSSKTGWATVDFKQAMVFGSAKGTNEMLSEIEAIVFIRKNAKQILIWDQHRSIIVAVLFDKSLHSSEFSDKIRKMLGLEQL
jgi:hypothetical protein